MAKTKKAATSDLAGSAEPAIAWMPAEKDYGLALVDGKVISRNPKGGTLASVPPWLKESELAQQLTLDAAISTCSARRSGCCLARSGMAVHSDQRRCLRGEEG